MPAMPAASSKLTSRLVSFWKLQIAGWIAYYALIVITFYPVIPEGALPRLMQGKLVRTLIGFGLTCILRVIYKRYARHMSLRSIVVLAVTGSVVLGSVWTLLANMNWWLTDPVQFDMGHALGRAPKDALDYSITLLAWSSLYFGIKHWQELQAQREHALRADALANRAQLEMLRYQLNPHFLFNALNSIRASIDEDPGRARRMVTEFSEFLRYSLVNTRTTEVALKDEIEAIRNYLEIERIRFEDRLRAEFEVAPAAELFPIPGFLIYPLVENAIKHGMQSEPVPLTVRLTACVDQGALRVEVANTGRWIEPTDQHQPRADGTRIGLQNIRQRLQQLYPERSRFEICAEEGWVRSVIEIARS